MLISTTIEQAGLHQILRITAMRDARNALEKLNPNDPIAIAARAIIESMEESTEKINGYTTHISSLINETNRTLEKLVPIPEAHNAVPRVGSTGRG